MVLAPDRIPPPPILFAALPLTLFAFKLAKMLILYRSRVAATLRQSLAAGIAGLALSHTIARAVATGFMNQGVGFFRTPKHARTNAIGRALLDAREELLFLIALSLAALGVLLRPDGGMLDNRIWALVLGVQGIPYLAALLVAFISALPNLSAGLVGTMEPLDDLSRHEDRPASG